MADLTDVDFSSFFRDLPSAGLIARDREKRLEFVDRYKRELMLVSLYLAELKVAGGANPLHLEPPDACDLCGTTRFGVFVDGETTMDGKWANMCPECFAIHGRGLGWGVGQLYKAQPSGEWRCIAGGNPDE